MDDHYCNEFAITALDHATRALLYLLRPLMQLLTTASRQKNTNQLGPGRGSRAAGRLPFIRRLCGQNQGRSVCECCLLEPENHEPPTD